MSAAVSTTGFYLRVGVEDDLRFIKATWIRAEGEASSNVEGKQFPLWQTQYMQEVLARGSTVVTIASPEDSDAIAGWCVTGPGPVVYYVYVRPEARRNGLAKMLLGSVLGAPSARVIYVCKPARERVDGRWQPSSLPIPSHWRFVPRAAHYPVIP